MSKVSKEELLTPAPMVIKEYGEFNVPVVSCPTVGCDVRKTPMLDYTDYCPKCGQAWDRTSEVIVPEFPEHHEGCVKR
jgi:hypothetical protein